MVFKHVTLRGQVASLSWGYQPAAALGVWTIHREVDARTKRATFTLSARLGGTVNGFALRQRPLLFTAPRTGKMGLWCWPVHQLHLGETTVIATLGPPEY